MSGGGLCWCASDTKCPHGISSKIPVMWEDMEQVIDDVLQQFDRKSIKRYLKRDADGNSKITLSEKLKGSSLKPSDSPSKGGGGKRTRTSGIGDLSHSTSSPLLSQTMPASSQMDGSPVRRPTTTTAISAADYSLADGSTIPSVQQQGSHTMPLPMQQQQPRASTAKASMTRTSVNFNRGLMNNSLPQLPRRITSPATNEGPQSPAAPMTAWGDTNADDGDGDMRRRAAKTTATSTALHQMDTIAANNNLPVEVPGETTMAVGLMRVADKLARLVLPWQAVLCPRAVETLFDLRQSMIQTKHLAFIDQMKRKLEEKVMNFIRKKEEEVEIWLENEISSWQHVMQKDESNLSEYVKRDLKRISDRAVAQDEAYRRREMALASALDDHERDATRQQLINFRRICRAAQPVTAASAESAQNAVEVRLLQDSIAKAQQQMQKQITTTNRDITRKMEEGHDWLCSLADNAITASESEGMLKSLYHTLDKEKSRGVESLHTALNTYKEQHSAILEAIVVFAGRIHQHASDYLQREQLVGRAFNQYLLSIVSGEIKTHTAAHKKNAYAWESKAIGDRSQRKEQRLLQEFTANIGPLDKLTGDFRERMRLQLDHITMRLQSVLNGRENDVTARKAHIHKKLAKHVNKACNARRQRLKDATAMRRDEFELEGKCIVAVEDLCSELRSAVDQQWVREHLKERRIYEAAAGRMERLEKSALIIWNKHSHLAFDQKEEYEEWLIMYKKERDAKISQRRGQITREWIEWRSHFGNKCSELAGSTRIPVKEFIHDSFTYDVDVPVTKNLADLRDKSFDLLQWVLSGLDHLRGDVNDFLHHHIKRTDAFAEDRKQALLIDWRDNLYLLNSAINRRVGALKDMEADLEETIRMTILQHEVENGVFEQLSCSRMEQFWISWRNRSMTLSRELRDQQQDYELSKNAGKAKKRPTRKDRQLDDLMIIAKEGSSQFLPAIGAATDATINSPSRPMNSPQKTAVFQQTSTANKSHLTADAVVAVEGGETAGVASDVGDTMRLKRILDDIRPEIYREFTHKLTRGLEKLRRDLGEGRKRLVPPYAVAKALISACDSFWERARLSERCVGRISSRGVLIFTDGLPTHCRALFNVTATMFAMQEMVLREGIMYIDCEDLFELMNVNIKQWFMIGLLSICMQFGDFGQYLLSGECMWACSTFGIDPPAELVMKLDAKGLDLDPVLNSAPTGFYSNDPVDLQNSLLAQTTELIEVKKMQEEYEQLLKWKAANEQRKREENEAAAAAAEETAELETFGIKPSKVKGNTIPSGESKIADDSVVSDFIRAPDDVAAATAVGVDAGARMENSFAFTATSLTEDKVDFQYRNDPEEMLQKLQKFVNIQEQVEQMTHRVPAADIVVLLSFLGRPNGTMEMTPHRVCQVITFWRRTAFAVLTAAFDPPSTEYPRIKEIVNAHNAEITGRKRLGYGNINCISPFEAVSNAVDWITSIRGLPISALQSLCLLARGGSCDPLLEDPKQTSRSGRIIYEVNELLESLVADIPRSMKHNEFLQVAFPKHIADIVKQLDLNYSGVLPLEALRTFVQREDDALTNSQISVIYWSLCRVEEAETTAATAVVDTSNNNNHNHSGGSGEDKEASTAVAGTSAEALTFQTGGGYRPVVETEFHGDPEEYLHRFAGDVGRYLDSMPTIDTNVILGYLPAPLVPASAHELVSDAMKLDASARNAMPSTCCVWLGQRNVALNDALAAITVSSPASTLGGNILLGVGEKSFQSRNVQQQLQQQQQQQVNKQTLQQQKQRLMYQRNIRTYVEVDIVSKYPELCEVLASNRHYGPAGNEAIAITAQQLEQQQEQRQQVKDHWNELLDRRLHRMDKLTVSWRDTMLNEWSSSLYQSRHQRYLKRVEIVKQCIGTYHQQYQHLRESIVAERTGLISQYASIEAELLSLIQEDYNFFAYHTSYLERALRRYEGQFERALTVLTDVQLEFQRHCGSIKRRGIERIARASDQLRIDLEESCNGLIIGYTAGYAQRYFDELIYRGEVWRKTLTDVQGKLILEKEKFMTAKDEIDRDLTIQITDKLTINRTAYRGHLEALADDTAKMLDTIATTRASYASVQKDANARLILRIEKAVRESRKLRVAAEQQAELEGPAMRDIRVVLDTARTSCLSIVSQIKETCLKQLWSLDPLRPPHRERMENRVFALKKSWSDLDAALQPVIDDYEREVFKQLSLANTHCIDGIAIYRESEVKDLKRKYSIEREELVTAFRKHFREYDLSEAAIFEKFNTEVADTVQEMLLLWGPSRPRFISQGLAELDKIRTEAVTASEADVVNNMWNMGSHLKVDDDTQLTRLELADVFAHSLNRVYDASATRIPVQFVDEKKNQLLFIEEMSMERNGDMVRPQVKAVMDLLLSGIEIDADFGKGYQSLVQATEGKARDCGSELEEFVDRYSDPAKPMSIGYSASLTRAKVQQRAEEVNALLEASTAHMVADHSRLDVLLQAGEKDIEEWANLTLQLIENAFHNAEVSYLSNLWPTPPSTPRVELIPEDEDRVGKLKAMLNATQAEGKGGRITDAPLSLLSPAAAATTAEMNQQQLVPFSTSAALREIDKEKVEAILGGALEDDDEVEEALHQTKKEARKLERAKRRAEKERQQQREEAIKAATQPPKVKPDETRELQQGWFECCTSEGYTYYFNPETEETLWDLPAALKKPLLTAAEEEESSNQMAIETPRELLMLEDSNVLTEETVPMRLVPAEHRRSVRIEPAVMMSQVAEEARAAVALAVETALDVTAVIRGRQGRDEKTIATLLGDRYSADYRRAMDTARTDDDPPLNTLLGIVHAEDDPALAADVVAAAAADSEKAVSVDDNGHIISDSGHSKVDSELQAMLKDLGLGSEKAFSEPLPGIEEELRAAQQLQLPQQQQWRSLGLNGVATGGDREGDSSDGEQYTGYSEEVAKRRAEQKFTAAREADLMAAEDELSIMFENHAENVNCKAFLSIFSTVVTTKTAHKADKDSLLQLNAQIKPLNAADIMSSLKTSWQQLEEIIRATAARELATSEAEQQLRTAEGVKRQQTILEHAEDIEEMATFLHDSGGLSKSNARRVGTECVLRNIATPKKLAKIWNRQHVSLREFNIDEDDMEELEEALRKLVLNASASFADPNAQSFHSVQPDYNYAWQNDPHNSSFHLDPGLVTEVADDYVDDDYDNYDNEYQQQLEQQSIGGSIGGGSNGSSGVHASRILPPKGDPSIDLPTLPRHPSRRRFSVTSEGYKSFKGGWIEGLSEDQNLYYYNVQTGESAWHLPEAHPEDVHEQVDDDSLVSDVALTAATSAAGEGGGEVVTISQAAEAAAAAVGLPYAPHAAHEPSHHFEHTMQEYEQHHYLQPQQQQQYSDNQYEHHDTGYDQSHDPNYGHQYDEQYHPQDGTVHSNTAVYYDHSNTAAAAAEGYYDDHGDYHYYDHHTAAAVGVGDYHGDGSWGINDALGEHSQHHDDNSSNNSSVVAHRRTLPVPVKADVAAFSKKEGVARQLTLLNTQDRWQNALVKTQHLITEQKSQYLQLRVEMFEKVSQRVDARLNKFVDDIKFMQKSLKKDLGESVSTERDLRRLFEQQGDHVVQAEKLSFILESLEKFKVVASERYESSFTQIDKFGAEWEMIKTELLQIGNIYDEGVSSNLEQCRLACEHNAKLFVYDQLKAAGTVKKHEMRAIRNALHRQLRADTFEEQKARSKLLIEHRAYNNERNKRKAQLHQELFGWGDTIEAELREMGYPVIEPELEAVPEEEAVMSFMLTQTEMELSLASDYDSIMEATRSMAIELNQGIRDFDETEKNGVFSDGSWFNKHRETLERHEQALHTTLTKVRNRMNDGYQLLNSKLEALDYDVERAAEEELFQGQADDAGDTTASQS